MKKNSFHLRTVVKPGPVPKYLSEDYHWLDTHYTELAKRYPEKWVAIVDGKVVSHGSRPDRVLVEAYRHTNHPHIALQFIEGHLHLYY